MFDHLSAASKEAEANIKPEKPVEVEEDGEVAMAQYRIELARSLYVAWLSAPADGEIDFKEEARLAFTAADAFIEVASAE